jgi:hypothetical protein
MCEVTLSRILFSCLSFSWNSNSYVLSVPYYLDVDDFAEPKSQTSTTLLYLRDAKIPSQVAVAEECFAPTMLIDSIK